MFSSQLLRSKLLVIYLVFVIKLEYFNFNKSSGLFASRSSGRRRNNQKWFVTDTNPRAADGHNAHWQPYTRRLHCCIL
jgi:hypothetical protein